MENKVQSGKKNEVVESSKTKVRSPSNLREVWTSPWYSILRCEPWEEQEATSGHQQATIWPFRTKKSKKSLTPIQLINLSLHWSTFCHSLPPCHVLFGTFKQPPSLNLAEVRYHDVGLKHSFLCPRSVLDFWSLKKQRHEPLSIWKLDLQIVDNTGALHPVPEPGWHLALRLRKREAMQSSCLAFSKTSPNERSVILRHSESLLSHVEAISTFGFVPKFGSPKFRFEITNLHQARRTSNKIPRSTKSGFNVIFPLGLAERWAASSKIHLTRIHTKINSLAHWSNVQFLHGFSSQLHT